MTRCAPSAPDPRIAEAKMADVPGLVDRLALTNMRRRSGELVGPCPNCGGDDRFNIKVSTGQFTCHQCDLSGGDQIALVRSVEKLDFLDALTWICGDAPADPAEIERRRRRAEEKARRQDAIAERKRLGAIASAKDIWRSGVDPEGTAVRAYLTRRGITPDLLPVMPACLRFHPDLKYMEHGKSGWVQIHSGPAMMAKIVQPSGAFGGVHRTWLDLDQPKGKIKIVREGEFATSKPGEEFDAKKSLGSKQGGTIRLSVPKAADVMVMGEGIETSLTAMVSGAFPDAAFCVGIDRGNMSGKVIGRGYSNTPDMSDTRAFVPPEWVMRLVFVKDGDVGAKGKITQARLEAGLKRAMARRPGLCGQIWQVPEGQDLNDILMGNSDAGVS